MAWCGYYLFIHLGLGTSRNKQEQTYQYKFNGLDVFFIVVLHVLVHVRIKPKQSIKVMIRMLYYTGSTAHTQE